MKKRHLGYGLLGTYADYGLPRERAKILLKECRDGEHKNELREAIRRVNPVLSQWLFRSIVKGESYGKMEIKMDFGEEERMPCCRNSFFFTQKTRFMCT